MGVLAVYDTVGIQNYIFASNKLAENVGGSKLVADIFGDLLPKCLSAVTGHPASEWRGGGVLDPALKAEIIYQGGGNAFVAFADEQVFQALTEEFLLRVNQEAPGVGIAVAAVETDFGDTYKSDFDKLNKRLALVKGGFNSPVFAGNQPITKQSGRTGLPAGVFSDGEYLSESQQKKRKRYERERYDKYKDERGSVIKDFNDLAFDKGTDSLIAIVHADGNNMGKRIKEAMKNFQSYAQAVPEIRRLSSAIAECYQSARKNTIDEFNAAYAKYIEELRKKFPGKYINNKRKIYDTPPLLELIGDGDDTTLVISGRFALDFAARLLRAIEETPREKRPFKDPLTACAGVVLFHSHYPFSQAYSLAEELCASAKKPSRDCEGSYIDFHLHQSGNVSGLRQLRERQYKVDGLTILRRPWRVLTAKDEKESRSDGSPSFRWFEETAGAMVKMPSSQRIPSNKIKALRNAIGAGETAAETAENQMRGEKLPKCPVPPSAGMSRYAAHFDILEMCDTYENLLNKGVSGNAE
jgi:hypothetical protein